MKAIKVFYCVYPPAGSTRRPLDLIRLLAKPESKHPAHITVRGPYDDYQDPRQWSSQIRGAIVRVGGVGTFLNEKQNTVFLKVESDGIRELWYKPDYPDSSPHLTIYDGDSPEFAQELSEILLEHDISFAFRATGLEPLVSGNGSPKLKYYFEPEDLSQYFDTPTTIDDLLALDENTRLEHIARLAERLSPIALAGSVSV